MTAAEWDALHELRLSEFSNQELAWSAEVCRVNVETAKERGASEPCLIFWAFVRALMLDELDGRQKPI